MYGGEVRKVQTYIVEGKGKGVRGSKSKENFSAEVPSND
jgi:hypothetical protein